MTKAHKRCNCTSDQIEMLARVVERNSNNRALNISKNHSAGQVLSIRLSAIAIHVRRRTFTQAQVYTCIDECKLSFIVSNAKVA